MKANTDSRIVSQVFFRLLPVQILIVAMGSVNSIVDGLIAGRFIAPESVGVIGLYYTMVRILEAVGAVLLGGTAVLCGKYMGSGRTDKTQGVFSLNLTVTFLIGAALTAVNLLIPGRLAGLLGAEGTLKTDLAVYAVGYALGMIPQLLAQQMAAFLQLERQSRLGYIGIASMIFVNVALDVLLVAVLDMGVWGLALATSACNWVYFLILASYYVRGKAQLKFRVKNASWKELPDMIKIGFPAALLVFALAVRSLVLNRIVLAYGGADGLSAMSAFNMICAFLLAPALGAGAVIRMLTSVFVGEEDRESIYALLRLAGTKVLLMMCGLGVLVLLLASPMAGMYFPDHGTEVFQLTRLLFRIYSVCVPMAFICILFSNYFQAREHRLFVNIVALFDGFFGVILPVLVLAPAFGIKGICFAILVGLIITAALTPIYVLIRNKGLPKDRDAWLLLPESFGTGERLSFVLKDTDAVTRTAKQVQTFCSARGVSAKTSYYAALCLEEMAENVVLHGFTKGKPRDYTIDVRVVLQEGKKILLRIKDDCVPFDPAERAKLVNTEDPCSNIGIRMVYASADEVVYQNLLGLNVLTIRLQDKKSNTHEA